MGTLNNEIRKSESEKLKLEILTKIKKESFIDEIKGGLGDKIKKGPVIKNKPKKSSLKRFWERIFQMF